MEVKCSNTEANLMNSETERLASIRAMEIERINSIKGVIVKIDGLSAVEEKIRIVLEGLSGGKSISELCRREGIAESLYYSWSKEVLEAGKTTPEGLSDQPERQVDPLSKNSIRFGYLMQPTVLRSTLH